MRIKLHIKCHTDDDKTAQLREMGIDAPEATEYRPFSLDPECIIGFYPDKGSGCFVMVGDMELSIREDFDTLDNLLNQQLI